MGGILDQAMLCGTLLNSEEAHHLADMAEFNLGVFRQGRKDAPHERHHSEMIC